MAISGIENINIGLQNQAAGSDSLYTAFNKSQNNFTTLFSCASPTTNFVAGNGVAVSYSNSNTYLTITNTGVTNLVGPSFTVQPEVKKIDSLAIMNKLPLIMPEPLKMENLQRPLPS